jgi:predicted transposase/invertase (TIGR01784 family)
MAYVTSVERLGIREGEKRGLQRGLQQGKQEVARNMLWEGMDMALIAKVCGLSIEAIQRLQAEQR